MGTQTKTNTSQSSSCEKQLTDREEFNVLIEAILSYGLGNEKIHKANIEDFWQWHLQKIEEAKKEGFKECQKMLGNWDDVKQKWRQELLDEIMEKLPRGKFFQYNPKVSAELQRYEANNSNGYDQCLAEIKQIIKNLK